MEKILMNDIIVFIENAMKENLCIKIDYWKIEIKDIEKKKRIQFNLINDYELQIESKYKNIFSIKNLSPIDVAKFKLKLAEAEEYSQNKTIESFWSFFNEEEENKLATINDLDNEDD